MPSSLKAQLARLGRIQDAPRASGSPVAVILRPAAGRSLRPVTAIQRLAIHGLTLLKAKRAIESMQLEGEVALTIPAVDSLDAFAAEMRRDGIVVIGLADGAVDVRALRQRLGLTQEQFALRYNLGVDNVQRWEQGERTPDRVAMNYLRVIERDPRAAAEAQEVAI